MLILFVVSVSMAAVETTNSSSNATFEEDVLSLTCRDDGQNSSLMVSWSKGKEPLGEEEEDVNTSTAPVNSSSLNVTNFTDVGVGNYSCEIQQGIGTDHNLACRDEHRNHTLEMSWSKGNTQPDKEPGAKASPAPVKDKTSSVTQNFSNVEVGKYSCEMKHGSGMNYTLACSDLDRNLTLGASWSQDRQQSKGEKDATAPEKGTLRLRVIYGKNNSVDKDVGNYSCELSHSTHGTIQKMFGNVGNFNLSVRKPGTNQTRNRPVVNPPTRTESTRDRDNGRVCERIYSSWRNDNFIPSDRLLNGVLTIEAQIRRYPPYHDYHGNRGYDDWTGDDGDKGWGEKRGSWWGHHKRTNRGDRRRRRRNANPEAKNSSHDPSWKATAHGATDQVLPTQINPPFGSRRVYEEEKHEDHDSNSHQRMKNGDSHQRMKNGDSQHRMKNGDSRHRMKNGDSHQRMKNDDLKHWMRNERFKVLSLNTQNGNDSIDLYLTRKTTPNQDYNYGWSIQIGGRCTLKKLRYASSHNEIHQIESDKKFRLQLTYDLDSRELNVINQAGTHSIAISPDVYSNLNQIRIANDPRISSEISICRRENPSLKLMVDVKLDGVYLTCTATGTPFMEMRWTFIQENEIKPGGFMKARIKEVQSGSGQLGTKVQKLFLRPSELLKSTVCACHVSSSINSTESVEEVTIKGDDYMADTHRGGSNSQSNDEGNSDGNNNNNNIHNNDHNNNNNFNQNSEEREADRTLTIMLGVLSGLLFLMLLAQYYLTKAKKKHKREKTEGEKGGEKKKKNKLTKEERARLSPISKLEIQDAWCREMGLYSEDFKPDYDELRRAYREKMEKEAAAAKEGEGADIIEEAGDKEQNKKEKNKKEKNKEKKKEKK